ncbi:MAG: hypothetical protein KBD63_07660 [Bacteriovoracaceae bacterium]|nr:hypothetical protein [Bacteriovoracaceae bacterium]
MRFLYCFLVIFSFNSLANDENYRSQVDCLLTQSCPLPISQKEEGKDLVITEHLPEEKNKNLSLAFFTGRTLYKSQEYSFSSDQILGLSFYTKPHLRFETNWMRSDLSSLASQYALEKISLGLSLQNTLMLAERWKVVGGVGVMLDQLKVKGDESNYNSLAWSGKIFAGPEFYIGKKLSGLLEFFYSSVILNAIAEKKQGESQSFTLGRMWQKCHTWGLQVGFKYSW